MDALRLSLNLPAVLRPLKPGEVALRLHELLLKDGDWNWNKIKISEEVGLGVPPHSNGGPSMIGKIMSLLKLPDSIRDAVEWGRTTDGWIGFSCAEEIAKCKTEHVEEVYLSALKHKLTKAEIRSVKQLEERSSSSIEEAVSRIIKRRGSVVHRVVWITSTNNEIWSSLSSVTQKERDEWFRAVLTKMSLDGVSGKVLEEKTILVGLKKKMEEVLKNGFGNKLTEQMRIAIS